MSESTSVEKLTKLADQRIGAGLVDFQAELTANGPRSDLNTVEVEASEEVETPE